MPPELPDRYRMNIRLGRDEDVEEWLATDEQLDRPVLVRFLALEAPPERKKAFLTAVRSAASVPHMHLQRVYAAGNDDSAAYAVMEWDGGVTVADRLRAGETIPVAEFLPNAAGLADGLAALHAEGLTHGAIDAAAIHFSAAHPAKLGAFGRRPRNVAPHVDTSKLAGSLRVAITGTNSPRVMPSHVVDGMSPSVDDALSAAERGDIGSAELAAALRAAPSVEVESGRAVWDWRWLVLFAVLVLVGFGIAVIGLNIGSDPESPFLYPATPQRRQTPTSLPDPVTVEFLGNGPSLAAQAVVYDPAGDGRELDELLPLLMDGDRDTGWQTEPYSRPLAEIKRGVGVAFDVDGDPLILEVVGTPATSYRVGWADSVPDDPEKWTMTAAGTLLDGKTTIQLPVRRGGVWLLWFTELPRRPDGTYFTALSEVRFLP